MVDRALIQQNPSITRMFLRLIQGGMKAELSLKDQQSIAFLFKLSEEDTVKHLTVRGKKSDSELSFIGAQNRLN